MKAKIRPTNLLILISIVAAVAILVASQLLDGQGNEQTVTFLIIAIWFVPFTILTGRASNRKPE